MLSTRPREGGVSVGSRSRSTPGRPALAGTAPAAPRGRRRRRAEGLGGLTHRGQGHHGRGGEVDVVVADEGDVVGHADAAEHRERLQHAHGQQVVRGEDGVGAVGALSKLLAGGPAGEDGHGIRFDDLEGRALDVVDRPTGAGETVGDLPRAERSGDEGDAPTPLLEEMSDREMAALDVVDRHRADVVSGGLLVDEDDRDAGGREMLHDVSAGIGRGEEDSGDALLAELVDVEAFLVGVGSAGSEEDDVPVGGGARFGATGDGGEEGVADVEHDQRDRAAAAGAQLPGGVVAHIAEGVDGGAHALDDSG